MCTPNLKTLSEMDLLRLKMSADYMLVTRQTDYTISFPKWLLCHKNGDSEVLKSCNLPVTKMLHFKAQQGHYRGEFDFINFLYFI